EQRETHLHINLPIEVLAVEIGRSAEQMFAENNDSDPLVVQPLYVAPSAAERNFGKQKAAKDLAAGLDNGDKI
ncbi:MAG TPA: hypothetical protein VF719_13675, partial [Abditibacteriaceae bacterium]